VDVDVESRQISLKRCKSRTRWRIIRPTTRMVHFLLIMSSNSSLPTYSPMGSSFAHVPSLWRKRCRIRPSPRSFLSTQASAVLASSFLLIAISFLNSAPLVAPVMVFHLAISSPSSSSSFGCSTRPAHTNPPPVQFEIGLRTWCNTDTNFFPHN
jgi:hypothetical protein